MRVGIVLGVIVGVIAVSYYTVMVNPTTNLAVRKVLYDTLFSFITGGTAVVYSEGDHVARMVELKSRIPEAAQIDALDGITSDAGHFTDEQVPARDGHLLLARIYKPDRKEALPSFLPVHFHIHGGGWCIGHPSMDDVTLYKLAQDLDIIVVSIGYRLAPEYVHPQALHDVQDVVRHVLRGADLFGIDDRNVAVGGFSAGGHLALSAAMTLRDEVGFQAVYLHAPVGDTRWDHPSFSEFGTGHGLSKEVMIGFLKSYFTAEQLALLEDPTVSLADSTDLRHLPPVLIHVCDKDVLRDGALRLGAALRREGNDVTVSVLPDSLHMDAFLLGFMSPVAARVHNEWQEFLRLRLHLS